MRIGRLELLRYGHFTDAVLELPSHKPDIHIMFGLNEAGKSTALAALEDFLFGIPHNSSLSFVHEYRSMRIGALLQKDGKTLEARRRKGKGKDTLLTREDVPFPAGDGVITTFLGGADRSFFERMFSLGHERLRKGGREILDAEDEVGQMLFAAGAGLAGLRDHLKALDKDADALWASRRAGHRKYYQAEDRLKASEKKLRESIVTAAKWQELRRALDTAEETYMLLEQEIEQKSAGIRKLSRIRRVFREVRRKSELDDQMTKLGEVTALPEDSRASLQEAEHDDATAAARIETLTEQLEVAREKQAALNYDEALLQREDDIRQLHERRIQVRAGKSDLPRRRLELASAETTLRRLVDELEWESSEIEQVITRIPARSKLAGVRTLLNRRGELLTAVDAAQASLEESDARVAEVADQIAEIGAPVDVSTLAAIIKASRESGDITSRIENAEGESQAAREAVQRRLRSLKPEVSGEEALGSIAVPPRAMVQTHRDARRDLDRHIVDCRDAIRSAEQQLARQTKASERVAHDEHAVPPEELVRVRQHRDRGWVLIRCRYIDLTSVPEDEIRDFVDSDGELADVYEAAMHEADETADGRFDRAEAAARLAMISRQIADQEDALEGLRSEEIALKKQSGSLDAAWEDMWKEVPFSLMSPDAMLEWVTARAEVLDLVERRALAERRVAALRVGESEVLGQLLEELKTLHIDISSLEGQPFRVVLEAASDIQRRNEQAAEARHKLEEVLRTTKADNKLRCKKVEKAQHAWSEWEGQWADALHALGVSGTTRAESVAAQIDVMDEMREIAVKVNELRHERIAKIERDISEFGRDVAEIVSAVATDLTVDDPGDTVLELEQRLVEAKGIRDLRIGVDEAIALLEEKAQTCEASRRDAREIIAHFQSIAGVEDVDELWLAIAKSESWRKLEGELELLTETLRVQGEGLSFVQLDEECAEVDPDQIAAREDTIGIELRDLRERLMEARESRSQARQALDAVGGDDAAAKSAADRQAALAEVGGIAEQYVRLRSAAFLLQWAIERYRREKQAPILKSAGKIFTALTGGSFGGLGLDFDDQDRVHLAGLRPNGDKVSVGGMSTGTVDQLYLALRVAAVKDYVKRASSLPFVADDLFINFDDNRAAAGFEVLGELAQITQVLFFTHHSHLVDIARMTLGPSLSVISLMQGEHKP